MTMPLGLGGGINPGEFFKYYHGVSVPDPITFVVSPKYLNRPNLYPRQATLLKIFFLRDDLFTQYDYDVIDEWIEEYKETGNQGISPDIYDRIRILKDHGYRWFNEILLVNGRRSGKGYLSSLAMSYVMWNYMGRGDPQEFYGIDRSKQLTALIFATNKDMAKKNLWKDFKDVLLDSECFLPYIESDQEESVSLFAPADFVKMKRMEKTRVKSKSRKATFQILPKEGSKASPRGFAAFINGWDEMAHVSTSAGAKSDAGEIYTAASPALAQFKTDAFAIMPSSPWEMIGKFYELYQEALEKDDEGDPLYPSKMMVQLASWRVYDDWERAGYLDLFPADFEGDNGEYKNKSIPKFRPLKLAIQEYDEEMEKKERANPDTFAVEYRAHFATALDAYLDPKKVDEAFGPWEDRPEHYGPPELEMQTGGPLIVDYVAHFDPASVNDRFGVAVGHVEYDLNGMPHCVFDLVHAFDPQDFEDHTIDYTEIEEYLWNDIIKKFHPTSLSHDQYSGPYLRQSLRKRLREARMPKNTHIYEHTATAESNWKLAETFKASINLGLVHFPEHQLAKLEMKFLQKKRERRVDHPDSGPVTSKDIYDACSHVVFNTIGDRIQQMMSELGETGGFTLHGGIDPLQRFHPEQLAQQDGVFAKLSAVGKSPARGRFGAAPRGRGRGGSSLYDRS